MIQRSPAPDPTKHLRILLAEDVTIVAEALEALLASEPGFEVVARVMSGDQVVKAALMYRPDVAVLDVDMPGMTGIEAAGEVRKALPDTQILLLTALEGSGHLHKAIAAGANGYVLKSTSATRLISAIRKVAAGGTVIDPDLAAEALRSGPSVLTGREIDILRLVGRGMTTEAIAKELYLAPGTVRNYVSHAMEKLGVDSRIAAFTTAERQGWL